MRICVLVLFFLTSATAIAAERESPAWATKDLKVGIIGTDTSHVPAFASIFRSHSEWRIKIVAACKGGSPDMPASADRLEKFTADLRDRHTVEIVDSIDELLPKVDVVLLHSLDGRVHLAQAIPVFKAGKRVFIDKPLASSVADARRIVELEKESGTPMFSSSACRYHGNIAQLRDNPGVGKVVKVQAKGGPEVLYGIHGVEAMYAVLGPGCVSVSKTNEGYVGKWKDGRLGVLRSQSGDEKMPLVRVFGTEGTADHIASDGVYDALVREIAEFFHTGKPPVDPKVAVEIIEFIIAAQWSNQRGGAAVSLDEVRM